MAAAFGILPLAALVHPRTAEGRATQEQLPGEILLHFLRALAIILLFSARSG